MLYLKQKVCISIIMSTFTEIRGHTNQSSKHNVKSLEIEKEKTFTSIQKVNKFVNLLKKSKIIIALNYFGVVSEE